MLLFKYLLMAGSAGLFSAAVGVLIVDVVTAVRASQMLMLRWQLAGRLALLACVPLLPALSIVVVPSGTGAVRVSQLSGTLPGTLYPGTHFVMPLVHRVELFNIRDQLFATNPTDVAKDRAPVLKVYSREGLPVGLGISVRYQLDPQRLAYIENNLPRPIETEIMPPVVANAFRQTISGYLVRDVFSTKREEVRRMAADAITRRLASDGLSSRR
jgi:regulator of protease activity HflC (stomatin/prohibitin superfamily)